LTSRTYFVTSDTLKGELIFSQKVFLKSKFARNYQDLLAFKLAAMWFYFSIYKKTIPMIRWNHFFLQIGVRKGGTRALIDMMRVHTRIKSASAEVHFFDMDENFKVRIIFFIFPNNLYGITSVIFGKFSRFHVSTIKPQILLPWTNFLAHCLFFFALYIAERLWLVQKPNAFCTTSWYHLGKVTKLFCDRFSPSTSSCNEQVYTVTSNCARSGKCYSFLNKL